MSQRKKFGEMVKAKHKLLKGRLPQHLQRCSGRHPKKNLIVCWFNSAHLYKPDEIEAHEKVCPDNTIQYDSGMHEEIHCSENWDALEDSGTYDPKVHCEKANLVLALKKKSKSAKHDFKQKRRMAFKKK